MQQATNTQHDVEPNPLDSTGLCLLSLDGGGVRGLSSLYILKSIMDRLNHERKAADLLPVKPCEVFDLIGGTSTGGLIAIMLGRLEMDVDQCIAAYIDLAEAVFGERISRIPFNMKGRAKARFDSAKLETAIREVIIQSGASETELLNDGTERGCRSFVCTVDRSTKDIVRLRSYNLPDELNIGINATICQAALATSAATTFFKPVSIGNRTFADGAFGANNPVDEVEGEASNIWCSENRDLKPLVKCFISIGTGTPDKRAFEENVTKLLVQTVVKIATETENTEKKFIDRWAQHFDENRYFRFNVNQGLQSIVLDEYKKKGVLEAATEAYLSYRAQKSRVRDCVQNLRLKQKKADTSFAALVNEFKALSIRLQADMGILNNNLTDANSHEAIHEAYWIVPFERNSHFTGRESELAQLEGMLFAEDRTTKIAITGLGGVGKTNLLLELVHRTRVKYKSCSIIWLPATNLESLKKACREAVQQLKIPGWEEKDADSLRLLQQYLSKESIGQWLLVFDNADDINMWIDVPGSEQGSGHLIEYLPKNKQGCIVFTTRDRKAAFKLAQENIIEMSAMNEDAAMQMLQKYLVNKDLINKKLAVKELLMQLTHLPLAIVQAAAYINENGIPLEDYLELLKEQEEDVIELLSEEFEDDGRYRDVKNPVAITFLISFEHIRRRDPLAAEYLSFAACIDPKDIPQSLLPPGPSRKKETDAIGTLDAYSFISRRSADPAFDIHRLVHLATRNWLRMEDSLTKWTEKAVERLEEVFPDNDYRNRSIWRRYFAHARFALESNLTENFWESRVDLAWKFGSCLYEDGRWEEARELFVQVMETSSRVLGEEHPDTLTSIANLASTYWNQGRWIEAEELEVQVMETSSRVLGEEHPSTLTSMNNLASTYWNQGRWIEAEELDVQVTETSSRVLGEEHPSTLTSMANLASTYWNQGRWIEAEELEVQVMETRKRVLGEEHPSTLTSMANLASTYRNQGRWIEAEELDVQVMETRKRVLGEEHPDTLTSMNNLAWTWIKCDLHARALKLMEECVLLQTRILGPNHSDTLSSHMTLLRWQADKLEISVLSDKDDKDLETDNIVS